MPELTIGRLGVGSGRASSVWRLLELYGTRTRDIAAVLDVSPRTVESHRAAIGAKLGKTSPAEMTRLWIEAESAP